MPELLEGDQVLVKRGDRAGQRAVITEIRPNAVRLRFADDEVLLYGLGEIEPANTPKFRVGDEAVVRSGGFKGKRGRITRLCPLAPEGRSHLDLPGLVLETDGCIRNSELELVLRDNSPKGEEVEVTGMVKISGVPFPIHEKHLRFTTPATEAKQPQAVRLVGITGRKRAGKDTVAARLVDHGFKRMAFADNVRKVALAIDPLIETEVGLRRLSAAVGWLDWEKAKEIPEVRRILQKIGTEGIRSLEPDFWIRQVMRRAVFSSAPVVITDVRFPNEADAIKKAGGIVIRVDRPGLSDEDSHSSETAMDDYRHDEIFQNRGTIKDLYALVDKWVADGFPTA